MPFLRKRTQRFREDGELCHLQTWLPGLGDKTNRFDPDKISNVEEIKRCHHLGTEFFGLHVDLDSSARIAQIEKMTFTHVSMRRNSARHAKSVAFFKGRAHLTD